MQHSSIFSCAKRRELDESSLTGHDGAKPDFGTGAGRQLPLRILFISLFNSW